MKRIALLAVFTAVLAGPGCLGGIRGFATYYTTSQLASIGELRADSAPGAGDGDTVDIGNDLGIRALVPWEGRLEIIRRRGQTSFCLGYGTTAFGGTSPTSGDIQFAGGTVQAGDVDSSVEIEEYRIEASRNFGRRGWRTGAYIGLIQATWTATLTDATAADAACAQTVYVPVAGLRYQTKLGPVASFKLSAEYTNFTAGGEAAYLLDLKASFGFVPWVDTAVEIGYRQRVIDFEMDGNRLSYDGKGFPSFSAVVAIGRKL